MMEGILNGIALVFFLIAAALCFLLYAVVNFASYVKLTNARIAELEAQLPRERRR